MSDPPAGDRPLVLLGGGGLAREVAEAVLAATWAAAAAWTRRTGSGGAADPGATGWRLAGVLDDAPALAGGRVAGVEVLGRIDRATELAPDVRFLATVGSSADPARRRAVVARSGLPPGRWATLVHPSAQLAGSTEFGPGCIVLALCVATADVRLGAHVVLMPGCILTHDDVIGDGATLASGVRLSGGVTVGEDAYLGTGALVREGLRIGAGAVVGMGAVVTRDVPDGEVWAGVPARRLTRAGRPR